MKFKNKSMKLKTIVLHEVTQAQKDKSCIFSLIDGGFLSIFRNVFFLWNTHRGQDFSKRPLQRGLFKVFCGQGKRMHW